MGFFEFFFPAQTFSRSANTIVDYCYVNIIFLACILDHVKVCKVLCTNFWFI